MTASDRQSTGTGHTTEQPRSSTQRRLSLWLGRLLLVTLLPAALLLGLEAILRLGGYAHSSDFFAPVSGQSAYTTNPRFGWRFFPPTISRTASVFRMPAQKRPGTYRIFVLGGSAAQGVPDPSYSFSRILSVMLHDSYPDTDFEVINTAMTAINSHVVLPIARDCAAHEPDLFILLAGNNEVVGPYATAWRTLPTPVRMRLIRASTRLRVTCVGHLGNKLAQLPGRVAGRNSEWHGMEMFLRDPMPANAPELEKIYEAYRRNLVDIRAVARDCGAGMVLCTVPVNLKDCPPFGSARSESPDARRVKDWDNAFAVGVGYEGMGKHASALAPYQEALRIDDTHAELHFRLGRCYYAREQYDTARRHFARARDLDVLRFRANSHINAIIREVAADHPEGDIVLVDAADAFADGPVAKHGIAGSALFYEHVHLNFDGNYELARLIFEEITHLLPESIRNTGRTIPAVPTRTQCANRLALTPFDRYVMSSRIWEMIERPPFDGQIDHLPQLRTMFDQLQTMRSGLSHAAFTNAVALYNKAIDNTPGDIPLRNNLAQLLQQHARREEAVTLWKDILEDIPDHTDALVDCGIGLQAQGRQHEAERLFKQAIQQAHQPAEYYNRIGEAYYQGGMEDRAMAAFRQGLKLQPGHAKLHNNLGSALLKRNQIKEATQQFARAVKLHPRDTVARVNLGVAMLLSNRFCEAEEHFAKAVSYNPFDITTRDYLAVAFARQNKHCEAAEQLAEAIKLDPDNHTLLKRHAEVTLRINEAAGKENP